MGLVQFYTPVGAITEAKWGLEWFPWYFLLHYSCVFFVHRYTKVSHVVYAQIDFHKNVEKTVDIKWWALIQNHGPVHKLKYAQFRTYIAL